MPAVYAMLSAETTTRRRKGRRDRSEEAVDSISEDEGSSGRQEASGRRGA